MKSAYRDIKPYVTKDGSEIRELMHPAVHGNAKQSLAEATVHPGCRTLLHRHRATEEIYYVVQGEGEILLGDERLHVRAGDTILASRPARPIASRTPGPTSSGSCAPAHPPTITRTRSS